MLRNWRADPPLDERTSPVASSSWLEPIEDEMKLSPKEATALAAAELRPQASMKLLRKESGLREHTLRYALHRLQTRGVCTPLPFINLHRLGFTILNVFFSVGSQRKATNDALLRAFLAVPEVVWVGEFGGEYQYGIAICTPQIGAAHELITAFSAKFKNVFFDKAVSVQYATTVFPRRYLSTKRFSAKPLVCRFTREQTNLDELDRRILEAVATPGNISNRQLAQKLGIPASTVDLRMRKLQERNVIEGQLMAVDCTRYGYQSFKLLIYSKGVDSQVSLALQKFCDRNPFVTYLIECLGNWDYEIGIEVAQTEQVTGIMQEIYEEFGSAVSNVKLLAKFKDIKFRWFPGAA